MSRLLSVGLTRWGAMATRGRGIEIDRLRICIGLLIREGMDSEEFKVEERWLEGFLDRQPLKRIDHRAEVSC